MLAGLQLTPTAPLDDQRQPAARMTDGSIRHRAPVSAAVARLLPSDNLSNGSPAGAVDAGLERLLLLVNAWSESPGGAGEAAALVLAAVGISASAGADQAAGDRETAASPDRTGSRSRVAGCVPEQQCRMPGSHEATLLEVAQCGNAGLPTLVAP